MVKNTRWSRKVLSPYISLVSSKENANHRITYYATLMLQLAEFLFLKIKGGEVNLFWSELFIPSQLPILPPPRRNMENPSQQNRRTWRSNMKDFGINLRKIEDLYDFDDTYREIYI